MAPPSGRQLQGKIAVAAVFTRRGCHVTCHILLYSIVKFHVLIDDIRGSCAVNGKIPVAGHVKRVDHGDAFDALSFHKETLTGHLFISY